MRMKPRTLLITLVATITLYALAGFVLLPAIARHVVNQQLEQRATVPAHLDSIRFNPFTLELTLGELVIGEPDQPEIAFKRLYANLQIDSLWTRALHLRDVELEQASTRVHFAEDGTLNLAELFILPAAEQPAEARTEEPASGPFPLRIDRLALIGNSLQFRDLRPAEPVEFGYDAMDIELTNLSTLPEDSARMQLSASGPYGARIDWQGQLSISPLTSAGTLRIDDARLSTFWPYVHEYLPLTLRQGALNVSSDYQLSLAEGTELLLSGTQLQLSELDLASSQGDPLLRVASLDITDTSLDLAAREVHLGSIRSQGLQAWAARLPDGRIDWQQLLQPTSEPTAAAAEPAAPATAEVQADSSADAVPAA